MTATAPTVPGKPTKELGGAPTPRARLIATDQLVAMFGRKDLGILPPDRSDGKASV